MPLVPLSDDFAVTGGFSPELREFHPESAPSFWQTMGAAFRLENTIGSAMARQTGFTYDRDPDFDAWQNIQGTPYQEHWDRFVNILNPADANLMKAQIDRETRDRQIMSSTGLMGTIANIIASGADWTTLLPGGAIYRGARVGQSVVRSLAAVGAAAGAATVVQEGVLQSTQELRTGTESALNIGGSVILGGILGGAASRVLSQVEFTRLANQLEQEATQVLREANGANPVLPRSASDTPLEGPEAVVARAMESIVPAGEESVLRLDQDGNTILGRAATLLGRSVYFLNPILRGLTSPSARYREVITSLLETSIYMTRNAGFQPSNIAVETLMKEWTRGVMADVVQQNRTIFSEMRASGVRLSYVQFSEEVGRAIRNGGSPNPHVARAAQYYTDHLFRPLLQRGIDARLFPEGTTVDSIQNNFTRVWNTVSVQRNEAEFRQIVSAWAVGQADANYATAAQSNARRIAEAQAELDTLRSTVGSRTLRGSGTLPTTPETTFIRMDLFDEAMQYVRDGTRVPRPTSLSTYLLRAGGIVDEEGMLRAAGITSRSRVGFLRSSLRTDAKTGGLSIDEAIDLAFNGRFFDTKPTRAEFVEILSEDLRGTRIRTTVADRDAQQLYNLHTEINAAMERMGITPDSLGSARSRASKNILAQVNRAFDTRDAAVMAELTNRIKRLETEQATNAAQFAPGAARDAYIKDVENTVYNKITGQETGDNPHGLTVATAGPLRETQFNIPAKLVDKFLVHDVEVVSGRFARTMSADIGLKERFGSVTLRDVRKMIEEEYDALRAQVSAKEKDVGRRDAILDRLNKRKNNDVSDLENVVSLLRGSFQRKHNVGNFARISSVASVWNFIRGLGGVVISSLTDLTRAIMVHGLGPTMRDGLVPLMRNIKKNGGFRLSVRDARLAGAVGETILNSRLANWTDVLDPDSIISPVDRFMTNLSGAFSRVSGMVYWNDFQKSFASVITQNRILRNASTYATISAREKRYMAFLGIDEAMAKKIHGEWQRAGAAHPDVAGRHDGVNVAGTEFWGDIAARTVFRAAVNKDIDSIIVTKGLGDVPIFANTPLGRLLFQFRSFALASHQRVLMRGVQENHAGVYLGMVTSATIGMFIYALRQIERGEEPSDNPGRWLAEGIDRSGLLSIFMEVNNAAEQVGLPGVFRLSQQAFPNASQQPPATRFAAETAISGLGGPTFGLLEDLTGLVGLPWRERVTEADVRAGARLWPGRNLPGLKSWFDTQIIPALTEAAQ